MVDETLIGRIYRRPVGRDLKWLWFLQTAPAPLPNEGAADTLEEARAALAAPYDQIKRGHEDTATLCQATPCARLGRTCRSPKAHFRSLRRISILQHAPSGGNVRSTVPPSS